MYLPIEFPLVLNGLKFRVKGHAEFQETENHQMELYFNGYLYWLLSESLPEGMVTCSSEYEPMVQVNQDSTNYQTLINEIWKRYFINLPQFISSKSELTESPVNSVIPQPKQGDLSHVNPIN